MGLFSRKNKSKPVESTAYTELKQKNLSTASLNKSNGRPNTLTKSPSAPRSRRTSMRENSTSAQQIARDSTLDATFASNNDSAYPPILPVPDIPDTQKGVFIKNNTKAAKLLGIDSQNVQVPNSRPTSSHNRSLPSNHGSNSSDTSDDQKTASRHDSFNSSGELPRLGALSSERPQMTFAEEIALEPAFSDAGSMHGSRSRPPSVFGHSRQVSRDSFRPAAPRRHSSQHLVGTGRMQPQRDSAFNPAEQMHRARSQHHVPTYNMPTVNNRMSMYADMERTTHRHGEVPIVPPFPGAHQPRIPYATHEHSPAVTASPLMRPQLHNETASQNSFAPSHSSPASRTQQASTAAGLPLAILDGLKVNKRGKLLDEEGDVIGELVEGELIDCVRQKANSRGEVLDEYGRVVGRVRTLIAGIGISSPALNASSPAIMSNTADYFNIRPAIQPHSPAVTPLLDPQTMHQRIRDEMMQKYRMDVPPVPILPIAYQNEQHYSPMLSAHHKYAVAPLGQSEDAPRAELDASQDMPNIEPTDLIPAFDLSEPFLPTPKSSPTSEPTIIKDEPQPGPVVKSVQSSVQVLTGEHFESNAASIETESIKSVADEDHFVAAQEELNHASRSTSFASIDNVFVRPQYVEIPTPRIDEDEVPTPREQPRGFVNQEPVSQPHPVVLHRAAPTSPTATRFFHRPAHREVQPHPEAPKESSPPKLAEQPVTQMTVPRRHSATIESQPIAAIVANAETAPQVAPSSLAVLPVALSRPALPAATASAPADIPPLKSSMAQRRDNRRRESAPTESLKSSTGSEQTSPEDSLSEGESVEIAVTHRKEVRISKLPPTTIPARSGLTRTLSDGAALGSRFSAMPSVPEAETLPEAPRSNSLLSPDSANMRQAPVRAFSARAAPPLPSFPRQNFAGTLPQSPFAKANAINNSGAGTPKRNSMPGRPGVPPMNARMAMNKNRYTLNAPLVSSPLSDRRKTFSSANTASSVFSLSSVQGSGSDSASERAPHADSLSIYSTPAKSRTYFTHAGRVTVEEGDPTPAMQAKGMVEITERPVTSDGLKSEVKTKKKGRFSVSFGKKSATVAAH